MSNLVDQAQLQALLDSLGLGNSARVNITPESHPATAKDADDEFEFGSSIDTAGGRRTGATPWVWFNQNVSQTAVADGSLILTAEASAFYEIRMVEQAISGASFRYVTKLVDIISTNADYGYAGMAIRNADGTGIETIHIRASSTGWRLEVCRWAGHDAVWSTEYTSDDFTTLGRNAHSGIWFEIESDGTNIMFKFSDSGVDGTFQTVYTEAINSWIMNVSKIGLFTNSKNASPVIGIFDLFRLR